jgi:hypothetical protein
MILATVFMMTLPIEPRCLTYVRNHSADALTVAAGNEHRPGGLFREIPAGDEVEIALCA